MSIERKHKLFGLCTLFHAAICSLLVAGCLETHNEAPVQAHTCTACHGDAQRSGNEVNALKVNQAAPPVDLNGESQPSARGVGAHQNHLTESASHSPISCTECHKVPDNVFDPGHLDNPNGAKITFGTRAQSNGSTPSYNSTKAACSNTYCHQAYKPDNNPNWTAPRDSTAACGSCHGLPPAAPHPQNKQCFQCHGGVVDKDRNFINKKLHINGSIDLGSLACNSCHGTDSSGAPPPDLEGNTDPKYPGVGAHVNHLRASATHGPVACNQCHAVPTVVPTQDNPGHAGEPPPAKLTFGSIATAGNNQPIYDFTAHGCSGTYCHGSYTPQWTAPRDSTTACGSCHGLPPPAPHPQKKDCSQCHSQVIDANRNFVNPALHVDGIVEKSLACNSCHGSDSSNAPPSDLEGNTAPRFAGVGAHANHVQVSATHGVIACNECHVVPTLDTPGHIDGTPPATVAFGVVATSGNNNPVYDFTAHGCSGTYCHQAYNPANTLDWTAPRGSSAACGTCHALPPPFVANTPISAQSHPKVNKATDCYRCHGMVVDSSLKFIAPQLHVNGTPDFQLTCSSCHGDGSRSGDDLTKAAPPADLSGSTDVTSLGVGAHQTHISGGQVSRPVPCGECHIVPSKVNDPGHVDDWNTAEVTFSGAAIVAGHTPNWNRQTASCTDSWCHGPVTSGNVSPVWNDPNVALTCTNCHGLPPPDPHPQVGQNPLVAQCWICHTNITQGFGFVNRSLHVNGTVDF